MGRDLEVKEQEEGGGWEGEDITDWLLEEEEEMKGG